jgi:hypothetical protein
MLLFFLFRGSTKLLIDRLICRSCDYGHQLKQ